ncbi:hypothetical protein CL176_05530 [Suicoccus acidiformans]|uniref:Rpn family recombination-promoting nuclease/putative transposase n=1 Tax=Suicoccus acidiformans TaxID=2036206 RepID=A0A347WK94_9LACT|nr:hypothetical protein CL176_05530 [Suicoccus acidiformans]
MTIELQLANHKSFLERTLYYACKSYIDNFNNPELMTNRYKYSSLRNTYAISILGFHLFDNTFPTVTHFDFKERETHFLLSEARMHTIVLSYFTLSNGNFNNRQVEFWQKYFTNQEITDEMPTYIQEAKQLAHQNNLSKEELEMAEALSKRQQIQMAREEFVRDEGIEQGKEDLIFLMYKKGTELTEIVKLTDYTEEEIKRILKKYNQ